MGAALLLLHALFLTPLPKQERDFGTAYGSSQISEVEEVIMLCLDRSLSMRNQAFSEARVASVGRAVVRFSDAPYFKIRAVVLFVYSTRTDSVSSCFCLWGESD